MPVIALFISFCLLYKSSTKAQPKTAGTIGSSYDTPSHCVHVAANPSAQPCLQLLLEIHQKKEKKKKDKKGKKDRDRMKLSENSVIQSN